MKITRKSQYTKKVYQAVRKMREGEITEGGWGDNPIPEEIVDSFERFGNAHESFSETFTQMFDPYPDDIMRLLKNMKSTEAVEGYHNGVQTGHYMQHVFQGGTMAIVFSMAMSVYETITRDSEQAHHY